MHMGSDHWVAIIMSVCMRALSSEDPVKTLVKTLLIRL